MASGNTVAPAYQRDCDRTRGGPLRAEEDRAEATETKELLVNRYMRPKYVDPLGEERGVILSVAAITSSRLTRTSTARRRHLLAAHNL